MKWIKYIFNVCFWTVVSLYLLIAVMVHIPYVQQSLASGVASVISSKLNTRVEIGRVDLGFLNRLVIDNTTIYDQGGKPMVRAARLAVRIDLLQLVEGRIRISSAQVFSTHFTLYRANAASAPNFQFALDALASKDSTKAKTPLDLSVNSFIMRHCSVKYDQLDRPHTPGRFNPAHLHLTNIGTYIRLNALTDDSLNVALNTLSATEQSGVKVDAMSLSLVAGGSECRLRDLSLRLPHSHIAIADITARYRRLADGKVDMGSLRYSALVKSASITPSDLSPVVPQLADYRNPLQLRLSASGTAKRVNVNRLQITSPSGELSASAAGWYEASKPHASWSVNIHDLHSSLKILQPLSYVRLRGSASCTTSGVITTAAVVNTDAGSADVNMTLSANRHFSGTLAASDIALGTLLNDSRLGDVSASLSLSGSLPKGKRPTVTAEGEVSKFAYNGYTYSNININGSYADNTVKGSLIIDDPNISLVAQGEYADLGKGKQLVVEAQLDLFRPSVTRLTD